MAVLAQHNCGAMLTILDGHSKLPVFTSSVTIELMSDHNQSNEAKLGMQSKI